MLIHSSVLVDSRAECPAGKFSYPRSTSCSPCENGFICGVGSKLPTPPEGVCNEGNWCDGLNERPCKEGTYNNRNQSADIGECYTCPAGEWNYILELFYIYSLRGMITPLLCSTFSNVCNKIVQTVCTVCAK